MRDHLARLTGVGMLLLVLAGCSDADEQDENGAADVSATADADGGDVSGDVSTGVLACFTGRWELVQMLCDDEDRTADLRDPGGVESMILDVIALEDGTCQVVVTTTGPSCTETVRHVYRFSESGDIEAISGGITGCDPEACQFNSLDAACAIEDRAGNAPVSVSVDGDDVEIVHAPPDGVCGGFDQTTTARYQRIE